MLFYSWWQRDGNHVGHLGCTDLLLTSRSQPLHCKLVMSPQNRRGNMAFVFLCSVMAQNDSTQTIVHAIKDNVHPDTRMVVVILPTNRKDRYDAIKTYCCVENPGMQLSASSVVPVQWACILEWLPQACDKSSAQQSTPNEKLYHNLHMASQGCQGLPPSRTGHLVHISSFATVIYDNSGYSVCGTVRWVGISDLDSHTTPTDASVVSMLSVA